MVQQAEKTLQKIRAQHQRYQKQRGTSPIESSHTDEETSSLEQEVPEATKQLLEALYMSSVARSSNSLSSEVQSVGLKTPSEESGEDDQEIVVINLEEKTPNPLTEVRDVEVSTVSTPLRDVAVLVTSRELVKTESVGTSPCHCDEQEHYKAGIWSCLFAAGDD